MSWTPSLLASEYSSTKTPLDKRQLLRPEETSKSLGTFCLKLRLSHCFPTPSIENTLFFFLLFFKIYVILFFNFTILYQHESAIGIHKNTQFLEDVLCGGHIVAYTQTWATYSLMFIPNHVFISVLPSNKGHSVILDWIYFTPFSKSPGRWLSFLISSDFSPLRFVHL